MRTFKWIDEYSKYAENSFTGSGKLRLEDEELRQLKRRIADLEEENAILKRPQPSSRNTRSKIPVHNFESGLVDIQQQLLEDEKTHEIYFSESLKTKAIKGFIALSPESLDILRKAAQGAI